MSSFMSTAGLGFALGAGFFFGIALAFGVTRGVAIAVEAAWLRARRE